jgi:MerR family transcriptional regulator, redox-sensitive transcriptional activator SoxR
MTIGELSRRTGLPSSTIRYYESERLVPSPPRVATRRVFEDDAVAQLAVVRLAREAGFTLFEIRRLVNDFGRDRWRRLAETKLAEIRASEEQLRAMAALLTKLLECRCSDLQVCGNMIGRAKSRPSSSTWTPALRGARSLPK